MFTPTSDRICSIEPNSHAGADIIAASGNPLEIVASLKSVSWAMKGAVV